MPPSLFESKRQVLDRFANAWNGSSPPHPEDFLPPSAGGSRLPLLVELLKIDMERRMKRGERVRLEEMYVPRFPELKAEQALLIELLIHEYKTRWGEPGLSVPEYLERWPQFRDVLSQRLQTVIEPTKDTSHQAPPQPVKPIPARRTVLGHYELLEELGRGGMGIVYRALDRQRGRQVALKTIQGAVADSLYRFKLEFRLRADLHHPNLVSLYELIAEDGQWFFTMELLEGSDFFHYVRGGSHLPVPMQYQRLRQSLCQLAKGIEALHAAGRLHRDLKPSNVLVTRAGRVVLLDFGLITRLNAEMRHESTERHLLGTVAFMSPEQARSEPLSPASDWYSVGVMLYETLTGRLPFDGSTYQILSDKQQFDPPRPRALVSSIPQDLDALCVSLLSRDPAGRVNGRDCLLILGEESGHKVPAPEICEAEVALVGRGEQLADLTNAYTSLRNRRPVAVFLSGSSGVGKSSLLQAFRHQLRSEKDVVVLAGQCYEQESVPYKAFDSVIDALGRVLQGLTPLEVQALLPRDAASLLRVFPALRRVDALLTVPQTREAPDPQEVRQRAFASLRELLARLADRKLLVVCIDDLQWGDADSAALLTELIRPPDAPCFLFVGCHRPEEQASPFLTALAESNRLLWSEVDRREINLDPLSPTEAEELATHLLTAEESKQECASAIARESGGNPFFVYELARCLRGERDCSLGEGAIDLAAVLWRRIEQLSAPTRELLAVTALAARPVPQDIACRAAGLAQGGMEELMLLRSQRLARGTGMNGDDFLVTYHDRIREIFRTHLSAEHTRRLHGRLAESLETWGRADAEWLATHWEYAGEARRAGEYYGRAADQAAETLAFDNAADLYGRALAMGAGDVEVRRQLQRKFGDALANAGRGGEAAKAYQVLIEGAAGEEAIELQRKVTEQFLISGYVDEGMAAAKALLRVVGMSMPRTPLRAVLGILLMQVWLWVRGVKFRERTELEAPSSDLGRIDASWIMATSLSLIDTIRGSYFQTRNLLLSLKDGEPYRIARAMALSAPYIACAGPSAHRRTSHMLAIGEASARKSGNFHARGMVFLATGIVAYLEGRWRDAFTESSRAESFFRSHCTGVYWELNTTQAFAMYSLVFLGETAELNRMCPKFMKQAQDRGDIYGYVNLCSFAMPLINMAADRVADGLRELSEEIERWTRKGFYAQRVSSFYMKTQMLLYHQLEIQSEQLAKEALRSMRKTGMIMVQHLRMMHWEVLGRAQVAVAMKSENPVPYLTAAERSALRLDREKRPDARSFAALIRAGIANCKGDLDKAKKLLEVAVPGLAACELGLFTAAARRRLGQLIGGDEGKTHIAEADAWMITQGVRNLARMTAVYAPGFADS